ncbi:hypothetical protein KAT08_02910 [Candidatus Babeliales bacterium]|nr:hypothetical protein [Candidatus Babeliales bacterium]
MIKRMLIVLMALFIFNEGLISKTRKVNNQGDFMTGFGKGQGRRFGGGPKRDGSGPFRDGRGPNPDCPLKSVNQDTDEKNDSGQVLKRDGSGPFRDGRGPNPDCPLKSVNQDTDEKTQKERDDSGRVLKRDGNGPNRDGQGPRGSNLGPKENCPKK